MTGPASASAGRVAGKVAVVTGGGSGLGQASSRRLAAEGASVVVVDWDEPSAAETVRLVTEAGGSATAFVGDVSDEEVCEGMVRTAVDTYGRLDILHNSVFGIVVGRVENISLEGWNKSLAISLTSYFLATKHSIPAMLASGGGSIVNTASILGMASSPKYSVYAAAKHAVIGLTKGTSVDYGPKGIRANAVCPGTMASPVFKSFFGEANPSKSWFELALPEGMDPPPPPTDERVEEMRVAYHHGQSLEGVAEPEDIASVVLFLASDDAKRVTGTTVVADGGLLAMSGLPDSTPDVA
jgi:meso-butanediol dehydrogenase/(S,S)-butanediol dehydrogenase/diacetyl reductase